MRIPAAFIRFLLEAAFLIVVAAVAAVAHLEWAAIIVVMFVAWLLVALVERTATRDRSGVRLSRLGSIVAAPEEEAEAEAEPPAPEPAAPVPEHEHVPPPPRRWRLWRRPVEVDAEPAPEVTPSHVKIVQPEPEELVAQDPQAPEPATEPEPEPEPEPVAVAAPEPPPAAVEPPRPAFVAQEPQTPEPAATPEPEVAEPAAEVVPLAPRADGPRAWNLWDLERLAREREGEDAVRDEERAFLLVSLRQFANPDGLLPVSFDPLVRESFGDLLVGSRR